MQEQFGFKDSLIGSEFYYSVKKTVEYESWKKETMYGASNIIADKIERLTLEKGKARLYDDQTLNYGELTTVDAEGSKKTFFYVLSGLSLEMYERNKEETSSIQVSKGKVAEENRHFDTAFFQESTEFLET